MNTSLATPKYGVSETGSPLLAEASHSKAEAYRAALEAPEGFVFVGFYCEHPLRKVDGTWTREPVHYQRDNKNVSGRKRAKDVSRSFSGADYDMDFGTDGKPACPLAQPMFVREVSA